MIKRGRNKDDDKNNRKRKTAIERCLKEDAPHEDRIMQLLNSCKRNMERDMEFKYLGQRLWQKLMQVNPAYGL